MKEPPDKPNRERYYAFKEILFGAGLAFDGVLLQALTALNNLDFFAIFSAIALACSLSSLTCSLFVLLHPRAFKAPVNFLGTFGLGCTIIGTGLIFFHLSPFIGLAFSAATAISCIIIIASFS